MNRFRGHLQGARALNGRSQTAHDRNAVLRAEVDKLRQQRGELQEKLIQTRATLQECRNAVRDRPRERVDRREIDTIGHNSVDGMDRFFEQIPHREPYEKFGERLRSLADELGITLDGRHVLDAGIGPGIALRRFLDDATPASVTGWDFSEQAIHHAALELPMAALARHDLMEPFQASFDVILCTEVLEHLEQPEVALVHLTEGLAPGGQLLLTVPDGRLDFTKLHINFWSPESWRIFVTRHAPGIAIRLGTFNDNQAQTYRNNYALLSRSG